MNMAKQFLRDLRFECESEELCSKRPSEHLSNLEKAKSEVDPKALPMWVWLRRLTTVDECFSYSGSRAWASFHLSQGVPTGAFTKPS